MKGDFYRRLLHPLVHTQAIKQGGVVIYLAVANPSSCLLHPFIHSLSGEWIMQVIYLSANIYSILWRYVLNQERFCSHVILRGAGIVAGWVIAAFGALRNYWPHPCLGLFLFIQMPNLTYASAVGSPNALWKKVRCVTGFFFMTGYSCPCRPRPGLKKVRGVMEVGKEERKIQEAANAPMRKYSCCIL